MRPSPSYQGREKGQADGWGRTGDCPRGALIPASMWEGALPHPAPAARTDVSLGCFLSCKEGSGSPWADPCSVPPASSFSRSAPKPGLIPMSVTTSPERYLMCLGVQGVLSSGCSAENLQYTSVVKFARSQSPGFKF